MPQFPFGRGARYAIRVEPGEVDRVMAQVEPTLAAVEPRRILRRLRSYEEIRGRSYNTHRSMAIMLGVVSLLLLN